MTIFGNNCPIAVLRLKKVVRNCQWIVRKTLSLPATLPAFPLSHLQIAESDINGYCFSQEMLWLSYWCTMGNPFSIEKPLQHLAVIILQLALFFHMVIFNILYINTELVLAYLPPLT